MSTDDTERKAFEAWMREQQGHPFAGQFANLMWKSWQARASLAGPKPLDDPRLQELFSSAIDGALTYGYQECEPAPAGHWLEFWWQKGRALAMREGELHKAVVTALAGRPS